MVNDERNNALADQYRTLAAKEENVIFGGRFAEYKYYDMAPIIEKVHSLTFWYYPKMFAKRTLLLSMINKKNMENWSI